MKARPTITKVFYRYYSDNGAKCIYFEWSDGSRTEGEASYSGPPEGAGEWKPVGWHMIALLAAAERAGIVPTFERW